MYVSVPQPRRRRQWKQLYRWFFLITWKRSWYRNYCKFLPLIKKIVFTTSDIVEESKLHINSVNKVLNKLVDTGYLIKEKKNGTNRVTFKYKNMYEVFVN